LQRLRTWSGDLLIEIVSWPGELSKVSEHEQRDAAAALRYPGQDD
jgi:hypothetical protein